MWQAGRMEDLTKLTVSALKQRLKAAGVAGTGEKPDLIARLKQVATGEAFKVDGINPAALKAGVLKKELATRGLPCSLDLESRDVLVGRLIDVLKQESNSSAAGGSASTGSAVDDADEAIKLAVEMAKQVLTLGEAGDAAGIFSLLGAPITTATPFAAQRKAYLSLSRMIHPDKIGRHFDGATRAFQELVTAFDLLTAPPAADDSAAGGAPGNRKSPTLSRSNDGCHRTRLFCPRCEAEWATADSGLEKYDYNLMMQGLKLYCCAACLCEFGCVSAQHRCPLCHRSFVCAMQSISSTGPSVMHAHTYLLLSPGSVGTCEPPLDFELGPSPGSRALRPSCMHACMHACIHLRPSQPSRPNSETLCPCCCSQTTLATTIGTSRAAIQSAAESSASCCTRCRRGWRQSCERRSRLSRSVA